MRIYLVLGVLLLAGCSKHQDTGDPLLAVQEAVFRYEFRHNASVQQQHASAYFLALGDPHGEKVSDPSDEFIARFSTEIPRVAKYSEASSTESGGVIDPKTQEPAIIFYVYRVQITGQGKAEVSAAYRENIHRGTGHTYQLKLRRNGWKVVRTQLDWIAYNAPANSAYILEPRTHHPIVSRGG